MKLIGVPVGFAAPFAELAGLRALRDQQILVLMQAQQKEGAVGHPELGVLLDPSEGVEGLPVARAAGIRWQGGDAVKPHRYPLAALLGEFPAPEG